MEIIGGFIIIIALLLIWGWLHFYAIESIEIAPFLGSFFLLFLIGLDVLIINYLITN